MDENIQKSCWGVTAWAVVLAGGALALLYVFGSSDVTQTAVVAIQ
ncbi:MULTISPECIES: hypothetical protein [Stappia]|nr:MULTISPECIES: hypothetical protein [Stappia]GGE83226.1 hypothetical protein GCM10007285_08420 [Stappia taiwanensis]